ncbi:MAG: hypothetical protein V4534_03015 [Myxococcota bacterium]
MRFCLLLIAIASYSAHSTLLEKHAVGADVLNLHFAVPISDVLTQSHVLVGEDWDLFKHVAPAATLFGQLWAGLLLKNGLCASLELLEKRQDLLRRLRADPTMVNRVQSVMAPLKGFESSFFDIYDPDNPINGLEIQMLYYVDEKASLTFLGANKNLISPMKVQNQTPAYMLFKAVQEIYLSLPLLLWTTYLQARWVHAGGSSLTSKVLFYAWNGFILSSNFRDPAFGHQDLKRKHQLLLTKLQHTAKVIGAILDIEKHDQSLPQSLRLNVTRQDADDFKHFVAQIDGLGNAPSELFQLDLATALAANRLLMDLKKPLARYVEKLSALDFYVAIAKALTATPAQLTLVKWSKKHQAPFFEAEDLRNPLLPFEKAVPNDISLGGKSSAMQLMMTGPNASGKSTMMRAVALNIYLAQTIGVAAASEITMRPFTVVNSFMEHSDQTGLDSSFVRELKNMAAMKELYANLKPDDRAFMILDEPFRSTNPVEAEAASQLVLDHFCRYPQSIMMVSTHLVGLTNLTGEGCKRSNMYMQQYRLEEGVYAGSNALDILFRKLDG